VPKIAFYTLGCRSNQYETDVMKKICSAAGFEIVSFEKQADIYVINTCTVTGNADKKSRHAIRMAKKKNGDSMVIATGCYVEAGPPELFKISEVDILLKNNDKAHLLDYLPKINKPIEQPPLKKLIRANLMIENGCENSCSYCIVPFVRGKITSKPFDQVIAEAKAMVKDGVKEIVLTGINLGEYGPMTNDQIPIAKQIQISNFQISLPKLIGEISKIDGLLRIRLSSIEPMYINEALIKTIKDDPKVCKHLHIPAQSGDDKILKAMNRNYTSKDFLNMTKKIREQIKDIAITTDIIIGFPGEDDKAFKNTCKLAEQARFSRIHIFSYSDRPGTEASKLPNKIDPKTLAIRHEKLEEIRDKLMLKVHMSFRKRPVEVLIEQKDRKTGMYEGLTGGFIRVFLAGLPRSRRGDDTGDECLGRLIPVKFKEFQGENVIAAPILV
jgi:threonylcarbamoyladenosine tRNA methylthiotransferase MtaB